MEFPCQEEGALRLSITESTMMMILHSAMDRAQEKVKSKDGILERLSERSKFCELAIMQLDGCLRFVQEETDDGLILESINQEKMLSDLTEIRDRLQGRLEATELEISKMDKEWNERIECELKLRQELEWKDKELESLYAKLGFERANGGGSDEASIAGCRNGELNGEFSQLKHSVDQQFWSIKQKLEGERLNISKINISPSNSANLEPALEPDDEEMKESVEDKDMDFREQEKETPTSSLVSEINIGIGKMGSDIDILKETFDLAFGRMHNAIYLHELGPLEKQWRWSIEKDAMSILTRGFIQELPQKLEAEMWHKGNHASFGLLGEQWSSLMNDMFVLQRELEVFCSEILLSGQTSEGSFNDNVSQETNEMDLPKVNSSTNCTNFLSQLRRVGEKMKDLDEQATEDGSRFVLKLIQNHESIIKKKSEELNWLKGGIWRRKSNSSHQKNKDPDHLIRKINEVIFKLDSVTRWSSKLVGTFGDCRSTIEVPCPIQVLTKTDVDEKVKTDTSSNIETFHSVGGELLYEFEKLKQENEDLNMQSVILEETYLIVFASRVKELCTELHNCDIKSLIREIVRKEFIQGWARELDELVSNYKIETHVSEEVFYISITSMAKEFYDHEDIAKNSSLLESGAAGGTKESLIRELDLPLQICGPSGEEVKLEASSEAEDVEDQKHLQIDKNDFDESAVGNDDETYGLVSKKLERTTLQLASNSALLSELGSSSESIGNDLEEFHHQANDLSRKQSSNRPKENAMVQLESIFDESLMSSLAKFPQVFVDFHRTIDENLVMNNARLGDLKCKLDQLVEVAVSLRKNECAYRKAFVRRCQNLQIAETEVDLLGDQVDSLISLLEKIYITLQNYAPFLQQHFGVSEIMKLIENELTGGAVRS